MGRIIYFMYTGHIRVTDVTVCQILSVATMFQVTNVIDACCKFLQRQLDPSNAIGIASFAEQHGCIKLQHKANEFIERHFTQVCHEEEFLQLSAYQLISLIRRDELNVQEEREVYQAVLNWVKYDEENRYPRMGIILCAVRCQLLTPSFLKEQMNSCDILRKVPACREYLANVFRDLTLHKRLSVKERKPNTKRMIFIAGGFYRQSLDLLEAFNVDEKTWTTLPGLRIPRSGLGAAFLKGRFFAVGGRNNSIDSSFDSDWVDRYNPLTEEWRHSAPMNIARHRVGVAVMDELMYAVGGSAGSEYHDSAEYYDPDCDRWKIIKSMHKKRLGVGVVVVNRLLYAIGGFDGISRLNTVECYHPENDEWSFVPSMSCGRSGAGIAAINQYIYVVGGFDGVRQVNTVERFDTENQTWELLIPLEIARSALSLTSIDGKLYAIGGFDGANFLTIVEVYDPKTNIWEKTTPLSSGRSGHASAVIYEPAGDNEMIDCIKGNEISEDKDPPNDLDDNVNNFKKYTRNCDTSTRTLLLNQYNFNGGHGSSNTHRPLNPKQHNSTTSKCKLLSTQKVSVNENISRKSYLIKRVRHIAYDKHILNMGQFMGNINKSYLKILQNNQICVKLSDEKSTYDDYTFNKILNEEKEKLVSLTCGCSTKEAKYKNCKLCKQLRILHKFLIKKTTNNLNRQTS